MASLLHQHVIMTLQRSRSDWRTIDSLADELEVDSDDIRAALSEVDGVIRGPVNATLAEADWVRVVERGYTWQEKVRIVLTHLARQPVAPARDRWPTPETTHTETHFEIEVGKRGKGWRSGIQHSLEDAETYRTSLGLAGHDSRIVEVQTSRVERFHCEVSGDPGSRGVRP